MITVGEAVQLILSEIRPMPAEEVPIVRAYGRILHEKVRASRNCRIRRQNGKMYVSGTGTQSSGVLRSLSLAQGLVVADEQHRFLEKGSEVPVILLDYLNPLQAELGF